MTTASDQIVADHGGFSDADEDYGDGRGITGQQQYSGRKVAQALIEAMGV